MTVATALRLPRPKLIVSPRLDADLVGWSWQGEARLSVAAKASFRIEGSTLAELEPQPVVRTDTWNADRTLVLAASDLVPYRPGCDVMVVGPRLPAGPADVGARATLALGRDHALLISKSIALGLAGARLGPQPVGWLWCAPANNELSITQLPDAMDWTAFHSAPADQRTPLLAGDEVLILEGLVSGQARVELKLPGLVATCSADGAAEHTIAMRLDTLLIDPLASVLSLVWRGVLQLGLVERARAPAVLTVGLDVLPAPAHATASNEPPAIPIECTGDMTKVLVSDPSLPFVAASRTAGHSAPSHATEPGDASGRTGDLTALLLAQPPLPFEPGPPTGNGSPGPERTVDLTSVLCADPAWPFPTRPGQRPTPVAGLPPPWRDAATPPAVVAFDPACSKTVIDTGEAEPPPQAAAFQRPDPPPEPAAPAEPTPAPKPRPVPKVVPASPGSESEPHHSLRTEALIRNLERAGVSPEQIAAATSALHPPKPPRQDNPDGARRKPKA